MKKTKAIRTMKDLTGDARNANKHTRRGAAMMKSSIVDAGFGDSITVDKNGTVISGNQRTATVYGLKMKRPIVVKTDGTRPVIHQRMDLDLTKDKKARLLATYQNRVAEVNTNLDLERILADLPRVDLKGMYSEEELAKLTKTMDGGEIIYEQSVQVKPQAEYLLVVCEDPAEWDQLKGLFGLKLVRRGGYKKSSPFDALGMERVITAKRLMKTVGGKR